MSNMELAVGALESESYQARVVSIVGPTASGKSSLADEVAWRLSSEVISADAMQLYRGMDIGTAKVPAAERRVPLRCIDVTTPDDAYSVARYAQEAHRAIDILINAHKVPVVCGGTGLYVRAALENMDFPSGEQVSNPIRDCYQAQADALGPEAFHALLAQRDPDSAALIHPHNVRRVVRAFELLEQGTTYAREHETLHVRTDRYPTLHIGLSVSREALYRRIDARVDQMIEAGLIEEVRSLYDAGLMSAPTAAQAIGYKEIVAVFEHDMTLDEAIETIKRSTRRYAKRQMTWFKSDKRILWLEAENASAASLADEVMVQLSKCE